jgi:hypothetical protein
MEIRDLALVQVVPTEKASAGPWDWEADYQLPTVGIVAAIAAAASWVASKFTRPTAPALRAAHA